MSLAVNMDNLYNRFKNQRGDTLIEVLVATVVISIVIASAYTLTTRASRANLTALERTTVNNLMREQLEIIRGAHNTNRDGNFWQEIESNRISSTSIPTSARTDCAPIDGTRAFYIDPTSVDYSDATTIINHQNPGDYPHPIYDIWAEVYQPPAVTAYADVYVRACWEGIGGQGVQTSGLVLRLVL